MGVAEENEREVAEDWRRISWDMNFSARSSLQQSDGLRRPSRWSFYGCTRTSIVRWRPCRPGLSGSESLGGRPSCLVSAADGAVVQVEGRHAHWTSDCLGVCPTFWDCAMEAECKKKKQGSQRVFLLNSLSSGDFPLADQDETVVRAAQVAVSCHARCDSQDFSQDLSIWLKTFSWSMVRRHRSLSDELHRIHLRKEWRMASHPLGVPSPNCEGYSQSVVDLSSEACCVSPWF